MTRLMLLGTALALAGCARATPAPETPAATTATATTWQQHDPNRPQPSIARAVAAVIVKPPADAEVLFDGSSLDAWTDAKGGAARWKVENGYVEVVPGTGEIRTRGALGDVQMHIEWNSPLPPQGEGQDRGNSGVFFMGQYEVQILDSYGNTTYPDGQAGSIYGQFPPLVNAALPPGEWQSYDIVFRRPRFERDRVVRPARLTVFHNGVLVQDNIELFGPTSHGRRAPYRAHPDRLPLSLQDHAHKVRFRNIWIREICETCY